MIPISKIFREALELKLSNARSAKKEYVDVLSKDLHESVGGYPSSNHRMATCCSVMQKMKKPSDKVLSAPDKGKGASLKIRYFL